jgi:DNA-binding CsgD family transcriptional regulator
MHARLEEIDRLILDIHSAPLDEKRWEGIVHALSGIVHADRAMLFSVPMGRCEAFWHVVSEIDPSLPRDYALEFAPEDSWALAARRLPAPMAGRLVTGDELVERRDFLRTRFFNEFAARYDIHHFMCLLLRDPPFPGAPPGAAFSFYRGANSTAFGADEREIMSRVAPHLVLALNTFWRVRALSLRNAALTESLDAVAAAIFIVDHTGRVIFENGAAQLALRVGDCLRVVAGCLEPSESVRERKSCQDALHGLLHGHAATVRLTVGPAKRTVILSTAPFSNSSGAFAPWERAAGLVWLLPSATTASAVKRIANLFVLTAAEERLLARLSAGSLLAETANSLQISVHTARNQLKAIQRKTGWRTQGELLRMVQQLSVISPGAAAPCSTPDQRV